MVKLTKSFIPMLALVAVFAVGAHADELDQAPSGLPQGLLVRTTASGAQEVFKVTGMNVTDDASAQAAIAKFANGANQISNVQNVGELDQATSTDSWYHVGNGFHGGGFGGWNRPYYYYNSFSYVGYYYPYYSYYYGGFPYYWYGYNPYCY
jgi:hypothetical protein